MDQGLKAGWEATTDGALSELAMYQKLLRVGVSGISRQQRPPGETYAHPPHGKGVLIGLVSGHFQMDIGGQQFVLLPGDILYIPGTTAHSGTVLGNQPSIYLKGGATKTDENFSMNPLSNTSH
ncbi:MAG: cupin domain-containing protein [Proteobacteria bacterium]|nr:cupin domain-containing protein [Pseudomonadota bacterium]